MTKVEPGPSGRSFQELRLELNRDYCSLGSWKKVAEKWSYDVGVVCHKATISRMAAGKYEPKRYEIRCVFGLHTSGTIKPIAGAIPDGTQALFAQQCECGQYYISNHPLRRKCFVCSPYRKRKRNG